jgi:Leucine-rich repeat (LRR) protein
LSDAKIDQILTSFLPDIQNISSPLTSLDVSGNRLTHVPSQLSKFERLNYVDLSYNNIRNLSSGAFNFTAKSINLFINNNKIRSIEPDAFQGRYNRDSNIFLGANNLTRFESKTFRSILEKIINLNDNPTVHVSIANS